MINIVNQAVNNYRQRIENIIQVGKKCLTKECSRNHRDSLCSSFENSHESTVNGSGYSDSQRRVVILCGRLKCGKTSFLNELLDCSSNFPDGEEPATGIFVRVKYSESEYWKLYRIDEESQQHHHPLFSETLIDSGTLLESHRIHGIIQNRSDTKFYSRLLDVGVLSDILKCGLDIVDTPGLGESAELDRFVLNYVPHLKPNLILYLFDFKPKFDLTDRCYVRALQEKLSEYEHCSAEAMQYLIIATKVDVDEEAQSRDGTSATVYDQGEVDQLIETFLCDGPHDYGDRFLPVYPVSADIIHEIRAKKRRNKYRETDNYSTHENYFRTIQQKITAKLRRLRIEEYLNCCQEMMKKEIRLLICGQINTDKSSFLASFLGRTVLLPSSDSDAFNRLLLKIDYNHTPFLRKEVTQTQGCCEEHDVALPLQYGEMISQCDDRFIVLHLGYPFDVLKSGIRIIHSPGLCAADNNPMDYLNIVPNIIVYLYDGRLQQLTSADKLNIDRLKEKFSSIDPIRSDCVQWILVANNNVECRQSFSLDEALSSLEPLCSRQNCEEFLPLLMFTSNTTIEADDTTNSDSRMLTFCQCLGDKLRAYTLKLASNFAYWGIHILDFHMDRTSDQEHSWIDYWYEMKTLSVDDDLVRFVQSDEHEPLINYDDAFKVYLLSNRNQFTSEHLFITELSEESAEKISFVKEKENIYACQWRTRGDIVFLTSDENSSKIYVVRRRRLDAAGQPTRLLSTLKEMPESRVYRIIGKIFELYDQPKIYKQFRPDLLCIDEHDNVFHEFEVPNHHELPLVLADCRKVAPFHLHPLHNQHYPNIPLPYRLYRFGWCLWIVLNRGLRQPVEEDPSSDLQTSGDEHSVVNEMIKLCVNVCTDGEDRVDHVWRDVAKLYHKLRHSVPTSH